MYHAWKRGEMHINFWQENLKETNHLEALSIDGRVILKWILKKEDGRVWTIFIWLSTGNSGELLQTENLWVP
jgi:hypothetical protein